MRIMGLDPGFDRLGGAVIEAGAGKKERLIFSGCLSTPRHLPFADRLQNVGDKFEKWYRRYRPQAIALEKIFFTKNQKTAMQIAEVRGVLTYLARRHKLTVLELTPQQVKNSLTGYGRADKKQVAKMVKLIFKLPESRRLFDDETDAIAISLSGLNYLSTSKY